MMTTRTIGALSIACLLTLAGCGSSGDQSREPAPTIERTNDRALAIQRFNDASRAHERGDHEKALELYKSSINADNTFFAAWNNMGQLMMDQKNYADAVSAFKVASDLQPSDPRPEYNIGLAYQTIGWGDESFNHFELALERDAKYLPALRGIVRSAEMLGRGDQVVREYIRSAMLRESDPQWRAYFERQRFRVEKTMEDEG